MNTVLSRLRELGLELPSPSTPGGSYKSVQVRGPVAYVAVQFPILNGEFLYRGRLGGDLNTDNGYRALQLCALNVMSQVNDKIGFDRILGLNHLDIMYCAEPEWPDAPKAANGASDLFVNVLGDRGHHTRSIYGVHLLPANFSVGLTSSFTLVNP